jgi:reversibly glycosylated polypeptide/UDP-arabinopyranose mutase
VLHFDWGDIAGEFGRDEWIFSRRNAGIRSYGFWKAYEAGADVIITLDDDCYFVESGFVATHIANLQSKAPERWATTFPDPRYMYTRGYPYAIRGKRKVVISHGLWSDKMDLDAKTQLSLGAVHAPAYPPIRQYVPPGSYFPMSSMNLAFSREAVPLMYFPLMGFSPEGDAWGYDRYDDIWAGLFAKKILDHLGWSASNGSPFVEHRKASDPLVNRKKERSGMAKNELLWQLVDQVRLTARSPAACYRQLAERIGFPEERYFVSLRKAMIIWSHLFG